MKRWISIICIYLSLLLLLGTAAFAEQAETYDSSKPEVLTADMLYSQFAELLDADTGEILLKKNVDQRLYPASTTKIMTLLLALESDVPLDSRIIIPDAAGDVPRDSSFVPVIPGEEMSFRDLLYGTMMNSGNDGANAIAVLVSGDVKTFVEKMNTRAAELGCKDTHFVNPHGYHDENHYSTAADMALISMAAMRNPDFREIVAAKTYKMAGTAKRAPLQLTTRNSLMSSNSEFYYEGTIGIKTGFHSQAGQCLIAAAQRNGKTLIAVALNSNAEQKNYKWRDAIRMFDFGFSKYTAYSLTELYNRSSYDVTSVVIPNASASDPQNGSLNLDLVKLSDDEYTLMVRNVEGALQQALADFGKSIQIELRNSLSAPIDAGEIIGSLTYATAEGVKITGMLIASRDVSAQRESFSLRTLFPFLKLFDDPVIKWGGVVLLALILLLILVLARRARIRQRRRREIYRIRRKEYERRVVRGDFDPTRKKKRRKASRPAKKRKKSRTRDDLFDLD